MALGQIRVARANSICCGIAKIFAAGGYYQIVKLTLGSLAAWTGFVSSTTLIYLHAK